MEAEKKQLQEQVSKMNSQLKEIKQECTSTLSVKERVFGQQTLELRQKVERLTDEKRDEVASLNEQLSDAKKQFELEVDGYKQKLTEKERQIKELKSQRDAIFEEMQGSTAKKVTRNAEMIPHIH